MSGDKSFQNLFIVISHLTTDINTEPDAVGIFIFIFLLLMKLMISMKYHPISNQCHHFNISPENFLIIWVGKNDKYFKR